MLAVGYSTDNLKSCDEVGDNEVIVTRKKNAEYLAMIDRSIEQLTAGKGQQHELIEPD